MGNHPLHLRDGVGPQCPNIMSIGSEQCSNAPEDGRLWVEPVGNIIVARVRGGAVVADD